MCKGVGKQRFYSGPEADVIFRPKNKTELPTTSVQVLGRPVAIIIFGGPKAGSG